jgi:acyl carrier protein
MRVEIAARLRLRPEEIEPDAHFIMDLGMSSLDVLCVLAFAEKSFSTRIPDDVLSGLTTLNKVVEAVQSHQLEMTGTEK